MTNNDLIAIIVTVAVSIILWLISKNMRLRNGIIWWIQIVFVMVEFSFIRNISDVLYYILAFVIIQQVVLIAIANEFKERFNNFMKKQGLDDK